MTTVVIGLLAAAAKVIFLLKLGALRRVLAFDALLDVMAGSVFGFLFYGTLTGMVIASIATLAFSGFCYCWKRIAGYDRWTLGGFVHVPPTWRPAQCAWQDHPGRPHHRRPDRPDRSPLTGRYPWNA